MGGDFAPASIVEGAVQSVRELGLAPVLVGRQLLLRGHRHLYCIEEK